MFGKNKPIKQQLIEDYDGTIGIVEIFHTIQGEGPFSGKPAVFVRTQGCVLKCHFCDTEFSTGSQLKVDDIYDAVLDESAGCGTTLVVITGGEPMNHQGIPELTNKLINAGFDVQLETCGVNSLANLPYNDPNFHIVVSPKTSKVDPTILKFADAFKYIIKHGEVDIDGFPNESTQVLGRSLKIARPVRGVDVYVSPCDEQDDEKNKLNLEQCIEVCMRYGFILNLQVHKIIGMP